MQRSTSVLAASMLLLAGRASADAVPSALAHVIASGSETSPQGSEHGLRTYLARSGNHFMGPCCTEP